MPCLSINDEPRSETLWMEVGFRYEDVKPASVNQGPDLQDILTIYPKIISRLL